MRHSASMSDIEMNMADMNNICDTLLQILSLGYRQKKSKSEICMEIP